MDQKVLPIGCEFEFEFPLFARSTSSRVNVYRYKVIGYDRLEGVAGICERLDVVDRRDRLATCVYTDGLDMYGNTIWRSKLDGDPAAPTYNEQLNLHGVPASKIKRKHFQRSKT